MDIMKTRGRHAAKKLLFIGLSAILPMVIFFARPFGMTIQQSAVTALLILVIIWWCTGIVNKTIASFVLILGFLLFSGAPAKNVFSFPLSGTFPLIALTYLFSRGVANSGLAEKYLEPLLVRAGDTPFKAILLGGLMLAVTIYAIPQPLARLIIISDIVKGYLDKTNTEENVRSVVLFGVFLLYIFVNMLTMNADIILNTASVTVAGLSMKDWEWIRCMAIPSLVYTAVVVALFAFMFRKELRGKGLTLKEARREEKTKMSGRDKLMLAIVLVTMLLWLTESFHGFPNWVITLCSIILMFAVGILKLPDLKAIDVPMLVFLTAAMSIGGVMSANGTADLIFSRLHSMIGGSTTYMVLAIMLITICMHMFLGSNTTTVSVVIPGIVYMCQGVLPSAVVMFIVYITSATQWLFPFHSVGLMMGASKNYFSSRHILTIGIPLSFLVFAAIFCLYLPWWKLMGIFA